MDDEQLVMFIVGCACVLQQHLNIQQQAVMALLATENGRSPQRKKKRQSTRRQSTLTWTRAEAAVKHDYYGPAPLFNDRQFERVFRISRSIADELLMELQNVEPFFRRRETIGTGGKSIAPEVKFLCALKMLAYGVSPSAFQDYFQMGLETMNQCFKLFCRSLSRNAKFQTEHLKSMTRADARDVSALHKEKHGVEGMIGSLDCMHVAWKNCPVAWQGQFKGKEESPTLVLEAFADYNLRIWHAAFGYAGTQNDINIWEQSPLLQSWLDGTWSMDVDFPYRLANQEFSNLYVLVDGIYPKVSRFVKTISVTNTDEKKMFASWQEASRKDIERAFGVMQRKFHTLCRKVELWQPADIESVVITCIILHNWMADWRLSRDEEDGASWYDVVNSDDEEAETLFDGNAEAAERTRAEIQEHNNLMQMFNEGEAVNTTVHLHQQPDAQLPSPRKEMQKRWDALYNPEGHLELQCAIIEQLVLNLQHH